MKEIQNSELAEPLNGNQPANSDPAGSEAAATQITESEVPALSPGNEAPVLEPSTSEQVAEPSVKDEIENGAGSLPLSEQEMVPPLDKVPSSSSTPTSLPTATSIPAEPALSNVAASSRSSDNQNVIQKLLSSARAKIQARRQRWLEKILVVLAEKGRISNREIRKIIRKSSATTKRYLNTLEKRGKVRQMGRVGRDVYYELIK